jgi:hypothetical protein
MYEDIHIKGTYTYICTYVYVYIDVRIYSQYVNFLIEELMEINAEGHETSAYTVSTVFAHVLCIGV